MRKQRRFWHAEIAYEGNLEAIDVKSFIKVNFAGVKWAKKRLPTLDRVEGGCYYKKLYQYRQNAETYPHKGRFRLAFSKDCKYCTMLRAKNQEEFIKKFTAFSEAMRGVPKGGVPKVCCSGKRRGQQEGPPHRPA